MPTLLHIDASPRGDKSISRRISESYVETWKQKHLDGTIIRRDLATSELTYVDLHWISAPSSTPERMEEDHKRVLATSDIFVEELLSADEVIIGTPMYNFTVPPVLKAWIDHIVRSGKTFKMNTTGFEGLVHDRKITVAIASGSSYAAGTPLAPYNKQSDYLQTIFGFLGVTNVQFIMAGGTNEVDQGKVDSEAFAAPYSAKAKELAIA